MAVSIPSVFPDATPSPSRPPRAPQQTWGRAAAWASCPGEHRARGQAKVGGQSLSGLFWKQEFVSGERGIQTSLTGSSSLLGLFAAILGGVFSRMGILVTPHWGSRGVDLGTEKQRGINTRAT